MRRSDGKLCFCVKETGNVYAAYMHGIMNEELFGIVVWKMQLKVQVSRGEVVQALNKLKCDKLPVFLMYHWLDC